MPLVRHLQTVLSDRLREEPVIVVAGARSVGKSTLLRACAAEHGVDVIDLDDPDIRLAVRDDPSLFVTASPEPVCIDEFQKVLSVLDVIKAALNRDTHAGRYVLTGSTRYTALSATSQSLTGRVHLLTLWPLSRGEITGRRERFLDFLLEDPSVMVTRSPSTTQRDEYEQAVLVGGFPLAFRRAEAARHRWYRDFLRLIVERDVAEIRDLRRPQLLLDILRLLAGQTAEVLNLTRVADQIGRPLSTVSEYAHLLEQVFLVHRLEGYGPTLSTRAQRLPKVHMVDSGLAAYLIAVTTAKLGKKLATTLTEFGHLLETFAVNEILKQAGWSEEGIRFSHFRAQSGREVDLVVETDDGRVAAVEIKASSSVQPKDRIGLEYLREKVGDRFVGGVLLYLGTRSYTASPHVHVMPLDRLWLA